MRVARQRLANADIAHDKFQFSKYLGEAVNTVKKQEHRELSQQGGFAVEGQ
jgi:transposase